MFHPVGQQSPSVYWRRRLFFAGAVAVLLVLVAVTVRAVTSGDDNAAAAGPASSSNSASPSASPHTSGTTPASRSTSPRSHPSRKHGSKSARASTPAKSSPAAVPACSLAKLAVAAAVAQSSYKVGDKPIVELVVTNTGTAPCVQDLADKQVELRVYNGESRVWGSHDCKIEPGTQLNTLLAGASVRVQLSWSGYTSQRDCAGTRQRAGAGSYMVYAALAGKTGKAASFSIS